MYISLHERNEKCDLPHEIKIRDCKGDVSWEDGIDNSTGDIHRCHMSGSLAEAVLLQDLQKWMLKLWQAMNYKIYDVIFHVR